MTRSLIQVSSLYSAAALRARDGTEEKEGRIERGRMPPPSTLPGLSVSHRGGERQATMGPFSAWLKVVI